MGLAITLLPLIPGLIGSVLDIVKAVKDDPKTPEDVKESYRVLEEKLNATMKAVEDVIIRNV